jgi:pyridoxamine 5'-phosphate oxidase-like protein
MTHLVTLNNDGSPQISIVWVGLDGDEIVCAHLGSWKKVRNIQQNARVALSMVTDWSYDLTTLRANRDNSRLN